MRCCVLLMMHGVAESLSAVESSSNQPIVELAGVSIMADATGVTGTATYLPAMGFAGQGMSIGLRIEMSEDRMNALQASASHFVLKSQEGDAVFFDSLEDQDEEESRLPAFRLQSLSDDGHAALVILNTLHLPERGTTAINLNGELAFWINGMPTDDELQIQVRQGAKAKVGKAVVQIVSIDDSDLHDGIAVTISAPKLFVTSLDVKESVKEAYLVAGHREHVVQTFVFEELPETITLAITHMGSLERKMVQVDTTVSVGL